MVVVSEKKLLPVWAAAGCLKQGACHTPTRDIHLMPVFLACCGLGSSYSTRKHLSEGLCHVAETLYPYLYRYPLPTSNRNARLYTILPKIYVLTLALDQNCPVGIGKLLRSIY